jgi:hypothetical protein
MGAAQNPRKGGDGDMGTLEKTVYELRIYDTVLSEVTVSRDAFGAIGVAGFEIDASGRHLLPLNILDRADESEFMRWLETRRIPRGRSYIEEILRPFNVSADDTEAILRISKGVSLNDAYSVVPRGSKESWRDYNLYDNEFDEVLQLVAYTGSPATRDIGGGLPSELSVSGSFPKTWREVDGDKVLYKAGFWLEASNTGLEPYAEYLASAIAGEMGLRHVTYALEKWQDKVCTTCRLFNTKDVSFTPMGLCVSDENLRRLNVASVLGMLSQIGDDAIEEFRDMLVFDSLIANFDRHTGNYGLLRENGTGLVVGLSPIFDNNLSLFTGEATKDLGDRNFLQGRLDYYRGALNMTLDNQARHLIGDRQKAQLALLPPLVVKEPQGDVGDRRFDRTRTAALNTYVADRAQELLSLPSVDTSSLHENMDTSIRIPVT